MRVGLLACVLACGAIALACGGPGSGSRALPAWALQPAADGVLRPVAAFSEISGSEVRSMALFIEAGRVMQHPRCSNCHPGGDSPTQGMRADMHDPPVLRGPEDRGVVGMQCDTCHQDHNLELSRVPGAPNWHLAPASMGWQGKSLRSVCEQLKDPARNGGRSLAQIVEHTAHDPLVAWGWSPGANRSSAPGSQAEYTALMAAWIEAGAECPPEELTP